MSYQPKTRPSENKMGSYIDSNKIKSMVNLQGEEVDPK